jgi:hypothetical protein
MSVGFGVAGGVGVREWARAAGLVVAVALLAACGGGAGADAASVARFVAAGDRVCGVYHAPFSDYATVVGENTGADRGVGTGAPARAGGAGASGRASGSVGGGRAGGAAAPKPLIGDFGRYAGDVDGFVARIEQLDLPGGPGRRSAEAFVDSVRRMAPAIGRVNTATGRWRRRLRRRRVRSERR